MGLREIAAADRKTIINDVDTAAGWAITLTPPGAASVELIGRVNDVALSFDPDTGVLVSGRVATAVFDMDDLKDAGLELPVGESDKSKKPWLVDFESITGEAITTKVSQSAPDRTLGLVVCILELYEK